jgi:hypothetical protein
MIEEGIFYYDFPFIVGQIRNLIGFGSDKISWICPNVYLEQCVQLH